MKSNGVLKKWSNKIIGSIKIKDSKLKIHLKNKKGNYFSNVYKKREQLNPFRSEKKIQPILTSVDNQISKNNIDIGSILILLNRKYEGKKVILLGITETGLFVVSGPFNLTGVPLRRVNPAYTIPTGAKLKLNDFRPEKLNDVYFKRLSENKNSKKEYKIRSHLAHKLRQMEIDSKLNKLINQDLFLPAYLKARK
mmetsp:Transcript_12968/g.20378  ORF Transcript_12968/g.20378 Transcript_12968/m.20378 type:complete len:195 (-) Transcript_12968:1327-1911(-)